MPDIHTDRLYSLSFDLATGKMTEQDYVTVDGGEGPRHVAIHPSNRWIYLLNEMGASVYFFEFNDKTGKITRKQDVALVPRSYLKKQKPDAVLSSEIVISPDGRFVLASMRGYFDKNGEDRIYVITIDENIGEMIEVRSFSCGGVCPRTIDFSPSGRFLLVGNKFSDEFVSIRYDDETGKLQGICGRIPAVDNATFCCV